MTFLKDVDVIINSITMKAFKYILILALLSIIFACSKDDGNNDEEQNIQQFISGICPQISGARAVYWDGSHNRATPLTQIPTIANPGDQFIHSLYPALGFTMPQGYIAQEITDQQTGTIGVNVFRVDANNNSNVVWRYIPSSPFVGQVSIADIVNFEIGQLKTFHQVPISEQGVIDCGEDFISNEFGFETSFSSRLIRYGNGNFTAQVIVQKHFMPSLGNSFISVTSAAGPTAEFDNLVMQTYLPLHWQLMVISDDVRDSDLDGTPDNQDPAPFNPDIR
ncbi:hypothetical protein [Psychroserpens sp.]|uniref:hypothetical protein n=1 Tax=Psychroserpens sp. TaxID=2020870 RepID=UPI00385B19C1